MASIERTAYRRFKRFMSERELHVFNTPRRDEIVWARAAASADEHLLALVTQLTTINRLGYFPVLNEVPAEVVGHIRPASPAAGEHMRSTPRRVQPGGTAIEDPARRKNDPADLINIALERLVEEGSDELPAFRTPKTTWPPPSGSGPTRKSSRSCWPG